MVDYDASGNTGDFLSKNDLSFGPSKETVLQAGGEGRIELPDTSFVRDADITREGMDLVLTNADGSSVIVEGYFAAVPAPMLFAPDGSALTPALVNSFVAQPLQYAQAGDTAASDESPVGGVQEVTGTATVTRVDGTVETIQIGTPIYQGDVIETDAAGAVNIVFIDETSFAVSEDARLAIDEYVFDPATQTGSTNFSVLKGVFVFTSGMIGREDPDDVQIETPVGSIGIRGTIIAGNVSTGEITVVEGAIVLKDFNGNEMTLALQFETARFNPVTNQIEPMGQMAANQVINNFSSIAPVSPQLFSSIGDSARENATGTNPNAPQTQQGGEQQNAPAEQQQQQNETQQQEDQQGSADQQQAAPVQQAAQEAPVQTTTSMGMTQTGMESPAGGMGTSSFSMNSGTASASTTTQTTAPGPIQQAPVTPSTATQTTATGPTTTTTTNDVPPPQVIQQQTAATTTGTTTTTTTTTVPSVNIAPNGADNTIVMNEDGMRTLVLADFGFTDADAGATMSGVRFDTISGAGDLRLGGSPIIAGQTVTAAQIAAGNVTFTPAGNANGAGYASFTFSVRDNNNAFDTTPNTITFNVTPVSDAPTLDLNGADAGTGFAATFNEDDTPIVITDTDVSILDSDNPDMLSATVTISSPPDGSAETLYVNTTALTAINSNLSVTFTSPGNLTISGAATLAQYQAALKLVTYDNTSGEPTAGARSISITVNDGTGNSNTAVSTINVVNTNDAPTGTDNTLDADEDSEYVFNAADFGFADNDAGASLQAVKIILPHSGAGTLLLNGSPIAVTTEVSAADIASGLLTFMPAANQYGAAYASFSFQVQDDGGAWSAAQTITFDVTTDGIYQGDASGNIITIDTLAGHDEYQGMGGDDTFVLGNTRSIDGLTMDGGTGTNKLDASGVTYNINLDLDMAANNLAYNGDTATVTNFTDFVLGSGYDIVDASIAGITLDTGDGVDDINIYADNITLLAGAGADKVFIGGNNATVSMGADDDYIRIDDINSNAAIDGGSGFDTLDLAIAGAVYDFDANNVSLSNIELIEMSGGSDTELTLSVDSGVFTGNLLKISMDSSDSLNLDFSAYGGGGTFYRIDTGNGDVRFRNTLTADMIDIIGGGTATINATGIAPVLNLNTIDGTSKGFAITDDIGKGFGAYFTSIGDINSDGKDDLMFGRELDDMVFTIYSPETFNTVESFPDTPQDVRDFFGAQNPPLSSLDRIGDFNGDGKDDYLLSFGGHDSNKGAIVIMDETGDIIFTQIGGTNNKLGENAKALGDVDGDGYDDILISAPGANQAQIIYGGEQVKDVLDTGTMQNKLSVGAPNGDMFVVQANGQILKLHVDASGQIATGPSRAISTGGADFVAISYDQATTSTSDGRGAILLSNGQVYIFSETLPNPLGPITVSGATDVFVSHNRAFIITTDGQIRVIQNLGALDASTNIVPGLIEGIDGGFGTITNPSLKFLGKINDTAFVLDKENGTVRSFILTDLIADGTNGLVDTDRTNPVASSGLAGAVDVEMIVNAGAHVGFTVLRGNSTSGYTIDILAADGTGIESYNFNQLPFLHNGSIDVTDVISDIMMAGPDMMIVKVDDGRIYKVDISNETTPKIVAVYKADSIDDALDMVVAGSNIMLLGANNIASAGNGFESGTFTTGSGLGSGNAGDIASIGDFNGDGKDDVALINATNPTNGTINIAWGGDVATAVNYSVFKGISVGPDQDIPVFGLGDINGDGKADMAVAATGANGNKGYVHVVYGGNTLGTTPIDLANHTSTAANGFTIVTDTGMMAAALIGGGAVGDFNGDGLDDMALAFKVNDSHNVDIYVLYGRLDAQMGSVITMADLQNPNYAFRIGYTIDSGITGTDLNDFHLEIGRAGDVNGDGLADLAIGTPGVDNNSAVDSDNADMDGNTTTGANDDKDGTVYVVYGQTSGNVDVNKAADLAAIIGDTVGATLDAQTLIGGLGDDTLQTNAHDDLVMLGGGGNDNFHVTALDMNDAPTFKRIDGGAGNLDKIFFEAATVDLSSFTGFEMQRIEGFDLNNVTATTLTIKLSTIMDMLNSSDTGNLIFFSSGGEDTLRIDTDIGVTLMDGTANKVRLALDDVFGPGEVEHTTRTDGSNTFDDFTIGGHTISIQSNLIDTIVVADV